MPGMHEALGLIPDAHTLRRWRQEDQFKTRLRKTPKNVSVKRGSTKKSQEGHMEKALLHAASPRLWSA